MEITDEFLDRISLIDLIWFFIKTIHSYIRKLARRNSLAFNRFFENAQIIEKLNAVNDKLSEHPILKFLALSTALGCTFPVVMFILFGIVSIAMTFTGFLLVEGTLLAVGGFCMFACISLMMMIMSIVAVTIGIIYLLVLKLGISFDRLKFLRFCININKHYSGPFHQH